MKARPMPVCRLNGTPHEITHVPNTWGMCF